MSSSPVASVVIPTHQRSRSLERTLIALARCDPPTGGFEVVVVDDGSTDATNEVASRSALPVRYLWQENAGPARARNTGWRASLGRYVLFTDDDTVPSPSWVCDLVDLLSTRHEVGGVGGRIEPLARGFIEDFVQAERLVGHAVEADGAVRFLVTANAGFRREALEQADGFDESFPLAAGEDVDLSYRLRHLGWDLAVVDGGVVAHEHPGRLSQVLRTFLRHGMARDRLAERHSSLSTLEAAAGVLHPAQWLARYRRYRSDGIAPARALVYLVLRGMGLVAYAMGVAGARR